MSSGSQSDRRGDGGVETGAAPADHPPVEAIERQLRDAHTAAESSETRFHLRQALQLIEALEE